MSIFTNAVQPLVLSFMPPARTVPQMAPTQEGSAYQQDSLQLGFGNSAPPVEGPSFASRMLTWLRQTSSTVMHGMRDPISFFVSQYKSAFNPNEDAPGNGNCGPASLTMCALAFGKLKMSPGHADNAIESTRRAMGAGTNENKGTSLSQLGKGAAAYGMSSRLVNGSLLALQAEIADGRLPIVLISPKAFRNSTSTGHYVVVTKIDDQGVHCNDPAKNGGPIVIKASDFMKGWDARGNTGISIGA